MSLFSIGCCKGYSSDDGRSAGQLWSASGYTGKTSAASQADCATTAIAALAYTAASTLFAGKCLVQERSLAKPLRFLEVVDMRKVMVPGFI